MTIFVDMDDTLVYSTELNNDAYNYALEYYNYKRIKTNGRITRNSLNITDKTILQKILTVKQKYYCAKWLPFRVVLNKELLKTINNKNNRYFLWTKANKRRTKKTINALQIANYFCGVIFDKKENFSDSIKNLRKIAKNEDFIIYENNDDFFKNQACRIVDRVKNGQFDVKGYYFAKESEKVRVKGR